MTQKFLQCHLGLCLSSFSADRKQCEKAVMKMKTLSNNPKEMLKSLNQTILFHGMHFVESTNHSVSSDFSTLSHHFWLSVSILGCFCSSLLTQRMFWECFAKLGSAAPTKEHPTFRTNALHPVTANSETLFKLHMPVSCLQPG